MDGSAGFPGAGGRADLPLKFRIPRAVQERSGHRMGSTNKSKVQKPIFPILGKFKENFQRCFQERVYLWLFQVFKAFGQKLENSGQKGV